MVWLCVLPMTRLKGCSIGPEGAEAMASGLEINDSLFALGYVYWCSPQQLLVGFLLTRFACSLYGNPIGDRGATALARALRHHGHMSNLECVFRRASLVCLLHLLASPR